MGVEAATQHLSVGLYFPANVLQKSIRPADALVPIAGTLQAVDSYAAQKLTDFEEYEQC